MSESHSIISFPQIHIHKEEEEEEDTILHCASVHIHNIDVYFYTLYQLYLHTANSLSDRRS